VPPTTPLPAATIILLRDGPSAPEVLLVERSVKSEFLPLLYVFPGGRVDESDQRLADRLGGIDEQRARTLAPTVAPDLCLAFFVAAIRETYEETGILLARRAGEEELVGADIAKALAPYRLDVQDHERSFREIVEAENLVLAGDQLAVHGHWITPEIVPRRFDTLFFTARTPPGQVAAHDGVESTDHVWLRPEEAVAQSVRGERRIIFPTRCNLETLCGFASADEAIAASLARPILPVLPRIVDRDGSKCIEIRDDAGYETTSEEVKLPSGTGPAHGSLESRSQPGKQGGAA
jgi:8-oxo-dGTP pyrophosphatase MutT (NUDIX family)